MAPDVIPSPVPRRLFRLLWLSIAAAATTISLKTVAWLLTDSVGLLSDAAEGMVNFVAALAALGALHWATKPADEQHAYGHAKAEYLSVGFEGAMILLAAVTIAVSATDRLLDPQPLSGLGIGLAVAGGAALINLAVGLALVSAGREHGSITLEADGKHLLTDVWTSVGVVVGVALVAITGWERLDPIVALAVAANIILTGARLLRSSAGGLMDHALEEAAQDDIEQALVSFRPRGAQFHAIRTRRAGRRAFISLHVLVPGDWTVQHGHDLAEEVEAALRDRLPQATVFTHVEPVEDPRSFEDTGLDRGSPRPNAPT